MSPQTAVASARHATWLWLLLALFVVRVVAQPLALIVHGAILPPFDDWQSGAVPYPMLVVAQTLIIVWLWRTAGRFADAREVPRRRRGAIMLGLGGVYFLAMVGRLVMGATLLREQRWFASPIPTAFHLVLATTLLVYGHFHFRYGVERQ